MTERLLAILAGSALMLSVTLLLLFGAWVMLLAVAWWLA